MSSTAPTTAPTAAPTNALAAPEALGASVDWPALAADFAPSSMGTPSHLWTFAEESGDAIDQVGSVDLVDTGTNYRSATGPDDRREWRFVGSASSPSSSDIDTSGSIRIGLVASLRSGASHGALVSNANAATPFAGFALYITNTSRLTFEFVDSSTSVVTSISAVHPRGSADDYRIICGINDGNLELITDQLELLTTPLPAMATGLSVSGKFAVGHSVRYQATLNCSRCVVWKGAEAERDIATEFTAFQAAYPVTA